MKENTAIKSRILFPLRLAEDANRGFVKVVQHITRLINYDFHSTRSELPDPRIHDRSPYSQNRYQYTPSKPDNSVSASASVPASVSENDTSAHSSLEADPAAMIALLFSDLAEERLSAVQWISDHEYSDALPMLESILLIEDDHQVYEEARKIINVLRDADIETLHRE